MSKRPVSFTKASPGHAIKKPLGEKQCRNQLRERLHLPSETMSGPGRGLFTREDLMVAVTVFVVAFLGAGAWFAN